MRLRNHLRKFCFPVLWFLLRTNVRTNNVHQKVSRKYATNAPAKEKKEGNKQDEGLVASRPLAV